VPSQVSAICAARVYEGELANVHKKATSYTTLEDGRVVAALAMESVNSPKHNNMIINQLQITKIIIRGMGQVASNKNDTQSGNQVVLFLVRSLESAMPVLSINCDRFSSVFVRKPR